MKGEIRNSKVETKDGGPAFPSICDEGYLEGIGNAGMSLRDYFAAEAMPILLKVAEVAEYQGVIMNVPAERLRSDIAQTSYLMADAMLEARGR